MTKKHLIGFAVGFIVMIIAVTLIVLWCTGVFAKHSDKTVKANELYAELNHLPDKIEVEISSEYSGKFTVEETEKIDQIYTLIMSANYRYSKDSIPPGNNIYLKFIYPDNKVVNLSSRSIVLDGKRYCAESYRELDNLLIAMGIDSGFASEK